MKYGRWEGRVKAPKGSRAYNALPLPYDRGRTRSAAKSTSWRSMNPTVMK
ncbi:hypothetical protein HBB16_09370 [Pseudonocardia sp. MCCB 268]|nr:hypothetical protein [Pseudonocardia cytotoxica]